MLFRSKLNLERAIVRAPVDGIVSKKSVEPGQMAQAGQSLMALVGLDEVWVVANFKETQLKNIRPGEPVVVSVDALGGKTFDAKVESIAAATGATFSLIPAENATGNFVKVVQRVPVRIAVDAGAAQSRVLRPGMSVEPTV